MYIDFLLNTFEKNIFSDAIVWRGVSYSYTDLLESFNLWTDRLVQLGVNPGSVVALEGDFSPNAVALLLALIEKEVVVVPFATSVANNREKMLGIAQVGTLITFNSDDSFSIAALNHSVTEPLILELKNRGHSGLIVFSSGSTGEPKAIVHDFVLLLEKFKVKKLKKRMLTFLLFDHWGGINTLLYILSNAGCIITVQERTPDAVLSAIQKYRADILPTSPSFLNLLLLSEAYKHYDLSSVERITYGTESMPESTLKAIHKIFPNVVLQQTYGLSEIGVMRSQSKSSDSLWVKIGGEGFETRVVDGMLQIKAESAMLGYLNAPSPFTEDGWFMTGDEVEVDGDYYLIKGRRSEIINVGGQKVYPAEVESVILQMDNVLDVVVSGEKNPILGNIVTAKLHLSEDETVKDLTKRLKLFCKGKLQSYQVPQKVTIEDRDFANARFKKIRK